MEAEGPRGLIGLTAADPALKQARWVPHYTNELGVVTYRWAHWFVKVAPATLAGSLAREVERLRWAARYLTVPDVVGHGVSEAGGTWMLTRALQGTDATRVSLAADELAGGLGRGLRSFHAAAPVNECPFWFGLDVAMAVARSRVQQGRVVPGRDFHPAHRHLSAQAALESLVRTRPRTEQLVVAHGDYCLPNVLFEAGEATGYVDLGDLGVACRWWDLAVASRSVAWNLGPEYEPTFLRAYGVALDAPRRDFYRLLYDVVA